MVIIATLGRAFIEVRADTEKFPDDVRRAMRRLATDVREDTDRAGNLMGMRLGTRMRQALNKRLKDSELKVDINPELNNASVVATEAALRRVTRDREVDVHVNRQRFSSSLRAIASGIGTFLTGSLRILGDFFNFGRQIGQVFGEAFGGVSKAMGGAAASSVTLGTALVNVAAAAAALAVALIVLVGIFGILAAGASVLYQALLLIAVLLPGLGLAFILSFAPLVLIFSNLSEALKAVGGPLEDFNEAIDDLGTNTGGVLTHLREIVLFFTDMREGLQEDFFRPINDALDRLDTDLGPTFQVGFERIATAAGEFAASFIELFDHPNTRVFFDQLFRLGELGFSEIGGAGIELVEAFAHLIDETFPEMQEAIFGIADTISGWADAIHEFADDPAMTDTLQTWEDAFTTITDLLGTAVELIGTFFMGFAEDGIPILEQINGHMESFIEYLQSPEGEEFFDGLRIAAQIVLTIIVSIITSIAVFLEQLGKAGNRVEAIGKGLERARDWLIRVGEWIIRMRDRFTGAWGMARNVAGAAEAIASAIQRAAGFAQTLFGFLAAMPGAPSVSKAGASKNAEGGIYTRPTFGLFGEAGPEVIIPLSKPDRAMELAEASGLTDMIRGGDGSSIGAISVMPQVRVFIGSQELKGMIRVEVSNSNRDVKVRKLAQTGSRG